MSAQTYFHSAPNSKVYASVASNTNLVTDRPGYDATQAAKPARGFLVCGSAGNIVYVELSGATVTLPAAPNVLYPVQAKQINSTTTATNILVMW